jgi:RecB family exonuclease
MITPMEKGNLVHAVLEQFVQEVLDRPDAERPTPSQRWSEQDLERMLRLAADVCVEYEARGVTGRPIYWRRDRRRIFAELATFLDCDSDRRQAYGASPIAAELAFGFRDGLAAVAAQLPDGRTLSIRGKVDRIDRTADGTLLVVDYKSGSTRRFKDLSEQNPLVRGTKLQLPVYGLAGRQHEGRPDAPVRAEYWFVSAAGGFKPIGYEVTDEILAATTTVLGEIVDGIEGGVFPARPAAGGSTAIYIDCEFCDPDGLGTIELRKQWERKRHDPALARYAALAEPDDLEPAANGDAP